MNIPDELKQLKQWVCADAAKVPYTPRGRKASPTAKQTWSSFESCLEQVNAGRFPFLGFVLSAEDPYSIIDLDAPKKPAELARQSEIRFRQKMIVDAFRSYTEVSQSGKGAHIIIRGHVPAGRRRDCVEVYSAERYFILTGKRVVKKSIKKRQTLLEKLYTEMAGSAHRTTEEDGPEVFSDEQITQMAAAAANGAHFNELVRGDWQGKYDSQSDADHALLNFLCYYSQNNEQVRRIFRGTALGERKKADRDGYLNYSIYKIRGEQPPEIKLELEGITPNKQPAEAKPKKIKKEKVWRIDYPPGLLGEIARYIHARSIRPIKEVSIAGAVALLAGICGRSYNVSGTGLNQYIILLGRTGIGKGAAASGIEKLVTSLRKVMPSMDRVIGPAGFASGQGLLRWFDDQNCFVSVMGEFGLTLKQICDPRANGAQIMFRKLLLDLYGRSGYGEVLRPSVYSDKTKNTAMLTSPCFSMIGESTPETFFEGLSHEQIADGLIPRFLAIVYDGDRPPKQVAKKGIPKSLKKHVIKCAEISFRIEANHEKPCVVDMTSDAASILDNLDRLADKKINNLRDQAIVQLWNRAHLKALKLSALVAVGINPKHPTITEECARWACDVVLQDVKYFSAVFKEDRYSSSVTSQEFYLRRIIKEFRYMSPERRCTYACPKRAATQSRVVPLAYIRRRCIHDTNVFKGDPRGAQKALENLLRDMASIGKLTRVSPKVLEGAGLKGEYFFL